MIVKNGARGLPACLASVRGIADRIVIGDTGSTDNGMAIAREFGAEIFDVPWTEDYAAARNQVLARAQCDWVLVLDADEQLDGSAVQTLPALVASGAADAFQSSIRSYVDALDYRANGGTAQRNDSLLERAASYPAYLQTRNTRLFRRDPAIYFEHRVHENVLDRLVALGRKLAHASLVIHHFGYVEDSSEERAGKTAFYGSLSRQKAAAEPENGWAQLEMGMHALDCEKDPRAALPFLLRAGSLAPALADAWLYAGICLLRLESYEQAGRSLGRALELQPRNPLVHASLGDLAFAVGDPRAARERYRQARQLGEVSPLCLAKLGSSEVQLGAAAEGMAKLQAAAALASGSAEILDMLAMAALLAGQPAAAREAIARRMRLGPLNRFGALVAGSVYLHSGSGQQASAIAAEALLRYPGDPQLLALATGPAMGEVVNEADARC